MMSLVVSDCCASQNTQLLMVVCQLLDNVTLINLSLFSVKHGAETIVKKSMQSAEVFWNW